MSEKTWTENAIPSPQEWTDWFVSLPEDRRLEVAAKVLDYAEQAHVCFVQHLPKEKP